MRSIRHFGLIAAAMLPGAAPAAGQQGGQQAKCNPPFVTCEEDGIAFPCEPCMPTGPRMATPEQLEQYRDSLRDYRDQLRELRKDDSPATRESFTKAIERYREGRRTLRAEIRAARERND